MEALACLFVGVVTLVGWGALAYIANTMRAPGADEPEYAAHVALPQGKHPLED